MGSPHSALEFVYPGIKAALVPSGLIFVNNALADHTVNDRHSLIVRTFGSLNVAGSDLLARVFDVRPNLGSQPRVMFAMFVGLSRPLSGLIGISQGSELRVKILKDGVSCGFLRHLSIRSSADCADNALFLSQIAIIAPPMSRTLFKSTSIVGGMTLLSRVLGFARDVAFAQIFGAGLIMDAFFVAFKIPNFMRRLFAEGAFAQAFVPVLGQVEAGGDAQQVRAFIDRVCGTLGLAVFVVSVIGVIAAPVFIYIFAPGFVDQPDRYALSVAMLRLTFPYLLFISLTAFAGGILNTHSRFAVPAFTPVMLNIVLIASAIWLAPLLPNPAMALAWGVLIAGVAQLAFQVPFLYRLRRLPRPKVSFRHPMVRRTLRLMGPAVFGSSVTQLNMLLDTVIASFLAVGSVSWLYYSDRLMEFPLGVFAIAMATVILPGLSAHYARQRQQAFSAMIDWALRLALVVVVPAAVGLFMLAGPLLTTLFHYGAFGAHDVRMAQWSLMAYALGLVGFTLVKIFAPGYFARQDTRTPVKVGVIAVVANIVFNAAITVPLALFGFAAPHAGLALSTSLAALVNAGLLYRGLRRTGVYHALPGWAPLALRVGCANVAMIGVLAMTIEPLATWFTWTAWARVWHLTLWIGVAVIVYFGVLGLVGFRPHQLRLRADS